MSTKKLKDRRAGRLSAAGSGAGQPTPGSGAGSFGTAAAAVSALGEQVTGQLAQQSGRIEEVGEQVAEFRGDIQAVQENLAAFEESTATRFEKLAAGEELGELREKLKYLDEKQVRLESLVGDAGSASQRRRGARLSDWAHEAATSEELAAWQQNGSKDDRIKIKLSKQLDMSQRGVFGATTTVVDDSLVGDGSIPVTARGLTMLLQEPMSLIDIVNEVPPESSDTYRRLVETQLSQQAAVAAKVATAVDGDPTPKDEVVLDNVEGYWASKEVYFHLAASIEGPFTIDTVDTANKKLTFATAVLDFDAPVGTLVCSKDYLATGEAEFAPAGAAEVDLLSVDMQAMVNYIETTWQRLKRTNLFELMPYLEGLLRERKRAVMESHLLYGSGVTSAGQLHGFLHANNLTNTDVWATLMAVGDNVIDLVLRSASLIPTDKQIWAVLRKEDWNAAIYAKDSAGNYVHGEGEGPVIINTPGVKAIGDVRVALSPKLALTTGLVFCPEPASDYVPGGDAELVMGTINDGLITGKQVVLLRESRGHLIKNKLQATRKITFATAPS